MLFRPTQPRVYLDFAATTPISKSVMTVMTRIMRHYFANPHSIHSLGSDAFRLLTLQRNRLTEMLSAYNHQVIFTRGGTEAVNIAIRHALAVYAEAHPGIVPCVIVSPFEHSAASQLCRYLAENQTITLKYAPLTSHGTIDVNALLKMITMDTALVVVQLVNSEFGLVQPIKKISHIIRRHRIAGNSAAPLFVCDAVQGGAVVDIHVQSSGVDYLALSASKFYGPKSGGFVCVPKSYIKKSLNAGVVVGGGQEFNIRSGTEDLSLVVGTVTAYQQAKESRVQYVAHLSGLQDYMYSRIMRDMPQVIYSVDRDHCAPHIVHMSIPGMDSEYAVLFFDSHNIAVSSQSACSMHQGGVSAALRALWKVRYPELSPETYAHIRVSFGQSTTYRDIDRCVEVLKKLTHSTYVRS